MVRRSLKFQNFLRKKRRFIPSKKRINSAAQRSAKLPRGELAMDREVRLQNQIDQRHALFYDDTIRKHNSIAERIRAKMKPEVDDFDRAVRMAIPDPENL